MDGNERSSENLRNFVARIMNQMAMKVTAGTGACPGGPFYVFFNGMEIWCSRVPNP